MDLITLLLYLLSLLSVVLSLSLSYTLYRRFQVTFLLHYLYFISSFFVAGFIDLVGAHLAATMLEGQEPQTVLLLDHIFIFLVYPPTLNHIDLLATRCDCSLPSGGEGGKSSLQSLSPLGTS